MIINIWNLQHNQVQRPGKNLITFLIVANLSLWLWETMEAKATGEYYHIRKKYYGAEVTFMQIWSVTDSSIENIFVSRISSFFYNWCSHFSFGRSLPIQRFHYPYFTDFIQLLPLQTFGHLLTNLEITINNFLFINFQCWFISITLTYFVWIEIFYKILNKLVEFPNGKFFVRNQANLTE